MTIKTPKPTKTDLIRYILNYWDPRRKIETSGPMFYNYEAEIVSNSVRKNSKLIEGEGQEDGTLALNLPAATAAQLAGKTFVTMILE